MTTGDLIPARHISPFQQIMHTDEGNELWSGREWGSVLGYESWRKFHAVIEKAETACKNSAVPVSDHFVPTGKLITIGKGAQRKIEDYQLSRYACYLIVQNADSSKRIVALGQSYFASQ